jgi:glycosyltransferase involved in cell wall biosynthesis
VVDNTHFYVGSSSARKNAHYLRRSLNLPENYFLTSCRFIEKKNLLSLLQAYRVYNDRFLQNSWSLVILGDGDLKGEVIASISRLGLQKFVFLPGFKQYSELPNYYGLAQAFVLASTSEQWGLVVNEAMASCLPVLVSERCGCARDLVVNGENGYTFDPFDVNCLADLMGKITQSNCSLTDMGRASNDIISQFGTDYFAKSLIQSAATAIDESKSKTRKFDKLMLKVLILIRENTRGE